MYSLVYDVMSDHYGPKEVIFVNGMISSSFALGGVIAGSLLYWTDLGPSPVRLVPSKVLI